MSYLTLVQSLRARLERLSDQFLASESVPMMSTALLIGLLAGLGTVVFRKAVDATTQVVLVGIGNAIAPARWHLILLPAAGGLLVGLWLWVVRPRGPGQGVAGIIEAAAFHGGRIDLRGSIGRVIGAVITIGSGGSAGPEDPSVQIGATVGSQIGQLFHLSERRIRTLVGCGAAAGIAAAFNAPISGVFFAIEIILGEFSGISVSYVVIAAVAGAVASQTFLGSKPAFTVPTYRLETPVELLLYFALGWLAAVVGVLYVRVLDRTERLFEHWRIASWIKPAIGGLAVGVLALAWRPDIMGTGYAVLESQLANPANDILLFFGLVAVKLIATSLTIGSGGQGGLFAPSLFLGGMLGIGFGLAMRAILPGLVAQPGAYGMVAMGAVLASAVRAPVVAILLPFEMTNDYHIILPLMLCVVTAYAAARWLERDSVYTLKLRARGVDVGAWREIDLMRTIKVGEAMTVGFPTISPDLPVEQLRLEFEKSGHHGFPVVDSSGALCGIVTLGDYERADRSKKQAQTAGEIMVGEPIVAFPDESLDDVLARLSGNELGRVPVVERRDPSRLLGVLRRSDILRAYGRAVSRRAELRERMARLRVGGDSTIRFVEIRVPPGAEADGKPISALHLPEESVIVSIKRRGQTLIPHGQTRLRAGDRVIAFVSTASEGALEEALVRPTESEAESAHA